MTNNNENEKADPEQAQVSFADEDINPSTPQKSGRMSFVRAASKRLSTISRLYDHGDKGYLDPVEKALRDLDESGKGDLVSEKAYVIMHELQKQQKKNVTYKKLLWALGGFAVLMSVAVLGLSFTAAILAKDTSVQRTSSGAELMTKDGKDVVGTKNVGIKLELEMKDEGGTGSSHACIGVDVLSNVWNEVASGSTVSVVTKNEENDPEEGDATGSTGVITSEDLRVLSGAKSEGDRICFTSASGSDICANFSSDKCSENGNRRLLSKDRRLERARRMKASFRKLVSGRSLVCNHSPNCANMNDAKCGQDDCAVDCATACGTAVVVEPAAVEPTPVDPEPAVDECQTDDDCSEKLVCQLCWTSYQCMDPAIAC